MYQRSNDSPPSKACTIDRFSVLQRGHLTDAKGSSCLLATIFTH
uniref:Uncharacterized protein n=1 Tax=Arundo donax TaxID=35708 RepID=A0A0A9EA08_ARUDO